MELYNLKYFFHNENKKTALACDWRMYLHINSILKGYYLKYINTHNKNKNASELNKIGRYFICTFIRKTEKAH